MTIKRIVVLVFVLLFVVWGNLSIFHVSATSGTVYIRSDGTIDPSTAPISRMGDTYVLNGNITSDSDGLIIQRDNVTFDGQGYWIIGPLSGSNIGIDIDEIKNIIIENTGLTHFYFGIVIRGGDAPPTLNVTVCNCNLVQNHDGLYIFQSGGTFYGNNITNNVNGIAKYNSVGNVFYHNNFIDNQAQVLGWLANAAWDSWDAGYPTGGNYWSDYNGTDLNKDGIGDTGYSNDNNYSGDVSDGPLMLRDHYPLMKPYSSKLNDPPITPELPSITIIVVFLFAIFLIAVGLTRKKGN